jgi:hypothetical protein
MKKSIVLGLVITIAIAVASIISEVERPTSVAYEYSAEGVLLVECGLDKQGRMHGQMNVYDEHGFLLSITQHSHGVFVSQKVYMQDGTVRNR